MRTIKKIGVRSFVKFNVYYMGFFGLIAGIFAGIPVLLGSTLRTEGGVAVGQGLGAGLGLIILVGAPVLYGFLGVVSGLIGGLILNLILKMTGGIDFEVEDKAPDSLPTQV